MTIKAIETVYQSYRFRSRLEARWAVFMDTLGVPYEYEKEGFDLGAAGLYLPDFWLPTLDKWLEIKAVDPTDTETQRAITLAEMSGKSVIILFGNIPASWQEAGRHDCGHECFGADGWDNCRAWTMCPTCKTVGITFGARTDYLGCGCGAKHDDPDSFVNKAYAAARSARFEHGERGR